MITTIPEAKSFRLANFTQIASNIINADMKNLIDRHELYIRLRDLSSFHAEVFNVSLKELKRRSRELTK